MNNTNHNVWSSIGANEYEHYYLNIYSNIYRQNAGKDIPNANGATIMELLGLDRCRPYPETPCDNPRPTIRINRGIIPRYDITDIQNHYIDLQV